ncbi:MAG: PilW family protein [Pseudomonadales bacterium]|nr:PilW family protein [Pseudomonadales bacterium]
MRSRLPGGFSLVELMISLALGSVVTAGVVQLFVANSETHTLLQGQSRMQESARFALSFIGRQVRQAGYRGCFSKIDDLNSAIRPLGNLPYEFDLRFGVFGYNAVGADMWSPSLDQLPNTDDANSVFKTTYNYGVGAGIALDEVISGTDVVTFRHLSQVEARIGKYVEGGVVKDFSVLIPPERPRMPTSSLTSIVDMVVGIQAGWAEFDQDHLVMVHDCEKATIFRVTTANPWGRNGDLSPAAAPAVADLTVGHDLANADATANTIPELALVNTFGVDAAVSAIESHTFFIAAGEGRNNDGNPPLSLWRKSGLRAPIELVEGVEDLQVLYGVDTDDDEVPNQYKPANDVDVWPEVTTVRVTIVVNSIDNVGSSSAADGLIRRVFSQTIKLRNQG